MIMMVDAEKLKRRLERRTAIARLNFPFISQVIDELSVEVPDTPDVLRESSNQTIIEALHVLNDEMATRLGMKIMVDTYDELQAKKEAGDGQG